MSSSSARGQTEPLAALLAVLVVASGLALYAGVIDEAVHVDPDRSVAPPTLETVEGHLTPAGVVEPSRLETVEEVLPDGYATNVTITTSGSRWQMGPSPAPTASSATRSVSVRTAPATVERGTLRVVTWS